MQEDLEKIDFNNMTQKELDLSCKIIREEFEKSLKESCLSQAMFVATHPDMNQFTYLITVFQDAAKEQELIMPEVIKGIEVKVVS